MTDPNVLAAIVTAAASIVVALISRPLAATPSPADGGKRVSIPATGRDSLSTLLRSWAPFLLVLLGWSALAPALIGHDFAGTDLLLASVVLILLAAIRPARPDLAAAVTFCTFAAVFVLGPLSNRMAGSPYDTQLTLSTAGQTDVRKLLVLLGLAAGTASVVAVICILRRPSTRTAREADESLISQLAQLNELHAAGALSDSEFLAAKARLIQDRREPGRSEASPHSTDQRL